MLIIGSHVSFGNNQLLGALEEALSYKSNTFMFYTGAPTNTIRKDINEEYTKEALTIMQDNNIDINNIICHAPYIVNLGNKNDLEKYNFSITFIKQELQRCDEMHITKMVLHPGNAVGITKEEGLNNIIEAINTILDGTTKCKILLETMAGKGTECASNIEEMSYLINNIKKKDQIGVCLDTCHLNDSGINLKEFDNYLEKFNNKIGIKYIECIHINDSKNEINSHKDRHENIGLGTIGFDNLINVIYHPKLDNIPKILETPYVEKLYAPYKQEIEMIRKKQFNNNLIEEIKQAKNT